MSRRGSTVVAVVEVKLAEMCAELEVSYQVLHLYHHVCTYILISIVLPKLSLRTALVLQKLSFNFYLLDQPLVSQHIRR